MEIRALTGVDPANTRKYGRQYTPLNGTKNVCLGNPNLDFPGKLEKKTIELPVQIPAYIPPQKLEMIDVKTGKKKFFTVENIQQLTELLQQGFELFSQIKGGQGKKVVVIKRSKSDIDPPKQAGMQIVGVLGGLIGAYILFSLLMSKK